MRRLAAYAQVHWVGRSPALPPGTTMADLAEDYARAIRARFCRPVPVVGFSTGGFLGLQLAVDHPDVVERLVVVGAAYRLSEQGRATNLRWVAALEQGRVSDAWTELARDVVSSEPARSLMGAALATIGPFLTPVTSATGSGPPKRRSRSTCVTRWTGSALRHCSWSARRTTTAAST